jgi:excinuclease ABC subunit C
MLNRSRHTYSIEGQPIHPHIKLTNELFPRLLSTRLVEDDGAEYFGAFLGRTAARILIDFLNTTFRLRTCTIPIDGSFPVPCTQFYAKRCLAPCVASLRDLDDYLGMAELARLFLRNDRKEFELAALAQMDAASERLEFERAAFYRDIFKKVQAFWRDPRRQVWIDDAVDTYVVERDADILRIYIITTRRARTLGSRVFVFQVFDETDIREVLADVIAQFYLVSMPREIRVPFDFERRGELLRDLKRRFGRPEKIVVEGQVPERVTALKALAKTKLDVELEDLKPYISPERIGKQLAKIFGLKTPPSRIEAFDAAHISGRFASAAMAVWRDGKLRSQDYRAALSEHSGEIDMLTEFIKEHASDLGTQSPSLILVDGGKAHVNAATKTLASMAIDDIPVVGAVKPKGKHGEVSHFIAPDGSRVAFNPEVAAMRLLKLLRDEAHDLANAAHGQSRDMSHYYQLAAILPSLNERERQTLFERFGSIRKIVESDMENVGETIGQNRIEVVAADLENYRLGLNGELLPPIVPIRYDDPNGEAGDLRPIRAVNWMRENA